MIIEVFEICTSLQSANTSCIDKLLNFTITACIKFEYSGCYLLVSILYIFIDFYLAFEWLYSLIPDNKNLHINKSSK